MYKWSFSVLAIVVWALVLPGCDESLPPRSDPTNILQAALVPPSGFIVIKDGMPVAYAGLFGASIKNIYTEALQKDADIQVLITVWLEKSSDAHRTIRLTASSLTYPILTGNLITLLPQDSARFVGWWDQRTDDGVPFWSFGPLTSKAGANGETYLESEPIGFVAQVSIQVFKNVQPRTCSPIHYTSTYRLFSSGSDGNN